MCAPVLSPTTGEVIAVARASRSLSMPIALMIARHLKNSPRFSMAATALKPPIWFAHLEGKEGFGEVEKTQLLRLCAELGPIVEGATSRLDKTTALSRNEGALRDDILHEIALRQKMLEIVEIAKRFSCCSSALELYRIMRDSICDVLNASSCEIGVVRGGGEGEEEEELAVFAGEQHGVGMDRARSIGWRGSEEMFAGDEDFQLEESARIARKLPFEKLLEVEALFRRGDASAGIMGEVLHSGTASSSISDSVQIFCVPVFGEGEDEGVFALLSVARDGDKGAFPFTEIDAYALEHIAALAYKEMKRCHRLDEVRYNISTAAERRDHGLRSLADSLRQRPALFPGERSAAVRHVSEGVLTPRCMFAFAFALQIKDAIEAQYCAVYHAFENDAADSELTLLQSSDPERETELMRPVLDAALEGVSLRGQEESGWLLAIDSAQVGRFETMTVVDEEDESLVSMVVPMRGPDDGEWCWEGGSCLVSSRIVLGSWHHAYS